MGRSHFLLILLVLPLLYGFIQETPKIEDSLPDKSHTRNMLSTFATTQTVDFILDSSHRSFWTEFQVDPGIYMIEVKGINKKYYLSFSIEVKQNASKYFSVFQKVLPYWDTLYSWYAYLEPGEIYDRLNYIYVKSSGKIGVKISMFSYYWNYDVYFEGTIILSKIADFDNIETLDGNKSINMSNSRFCIYKIPSGTYFDLNLDFTGYTSVFNVTYIYVTISPFDMSDFDDNEGIEIYLNDTKIGYITKNNYELSEFAVSEFGSYELKLKYFSSSTSDGVYIDGVYVYRKIADSAYYSDYMYVHERLNSSNPEVTVGYIPTQIFLFPYIYYTLYDFENGLSLYSDGVFVNSSNSITYYAYKDLYLMVRKFPAETVSELNIGFKKIDYTTIDVGSKTFTLNSTNSEKYLLLDINKDHYYKISLEIENSNKGVVSLESFDYLIAYRDKEYNTSTVAYKFAVLEYYPTYLDGPVRDQPYKPYTIESISLQYSGGTLVDIDSISFGSWFGRVPMVLRGIDLGDSGSLEVKVTVEDLGAISTINPGEKKDVSLNYGTGDIYEILKVDVDSFLEYKVTIKPKDVKTEGNVNAFMIARAMNASFFGWTYFSASRRFESVNSLPIVLEFVSNLPTPAYIILKRGTSENNFNGVVEVSLETINPDKTNEFSWSSSYGDYVRIFYSELSDTHVYRMKINIDPSVDAQVFMIHESGIIGAMLEEANLMDSWNYIMVYDATFVSVRFTPVKSGKIYFVVVVFGEGDINITIEDITPITQNAIIWLPVGIGAGVGIMYAALRIIEKRKKS